MTKQIVSAAILLVLVVLTAAALVWIDNGKTSAGHSAKEARHATNK
jgi:hypothetical protein